MTEAGNGRGGSAWEPYRPSADEPWNPRRVVHLHRRAGFAATWAEIERDLAEGPAASVRRLVEARSHASSEFEMMASTIADAAVSSSEPNRLEAWWLFRMIFSPDPLSERLTLMWHNHFATGNQKVNDLSAMRQQNEALRLHARAPFGTLLNAVVRDPALLVWLDAAVNRKGHPNENLARELMELFTLGIGPYTERDVKETARALTGWTVADGGFRESAAVHDDAEKTILGKTGHWNGSSLMGILLEHHATARRLAWRLCETFMGEGNTGPEAIDELANVLRAHGLDVGRAVSLILGSRAFFAEANLGAGVVGPVEFVVGTVRALDCVAPPPSTVFLAEWVKRIGQELFYPPNVGGWPGGRAWLSTRGMIARVNFANALVAGEGFGPARPVDILRIAQRGGEEPSIDHTVRALAELLIGADPGNMLRRRIAMEASAGAGSSAEIARRVAGMILSMPEAQVA